MNKEKMEQHKQKIIDAFLRNMYMDLDRTLGSNLTEQDWFKRNYENAGDWNELTNDPAYVRYVRKLAETL